MNNNNSVVLSYRTLARVSRRQPSVLQHCEIIDVA